MKRLLLIILCFAPALWGAGQYKFKPVNIQLPAPLDSGSVPYEFSSLARWGQQILLIPALKKEYVSKYGLSLFLIEEKSLINAFADPNARTEASRLQIDSASYLKHLYALRGYDGIEGTVVIDDTIYFSIETDGSSGAEKCHIARGHFEKTKKGVHQIIIDTTVSLKRNILDKGKKKDNNSGYESLAYDPVSKKLIAILEEKDEKGRLAYYMIDRDLKRTSISFLNQIPEDRLADICFTDGSLYGINSRYESDSFCRSVIVSIDLGKKIAEEVGELAENDCPCNWEGMLPFAKGWLIISDNENSGGKDIRKSRLIYCSAPVK